MSRIALAIAVVGACSFLRAQNSEPISIDYREKTPVTLGTGWNTATGVPTLHQCVTGVEKQDTGQKVQVRVYSVSDDASSLDALRVSAEARYRALTGSASAKYSFATNRRWDSKAANFSAYGLVTNGTHYLSPEGDKSVDLLPVYANLARTDFRRFTEQCGDAFVWSKTAGAELSVDVQVQTESLEEKEEIEAKANGSFGGFSLDSDFMKKMETFHKTSSTHFVLLTSGGSGEPVAAKREEVDAAITALAMRAAKAESPLQIGLRRYVDSGLSGYQPKGSSLGWPLDGAGELAVQYEQSEFLFQRANEINQSSALYVFSRQDNPQAIVELARELNSRATALGDRARACMKDAVACNVPKELAGSDYVYRLRLPVLASDIQWQAQVDSQAKAISTLRNEIHDENDKITILMRQSGNAYTDAQITAAQNRHNADRLDRLRVVTASLKALDTERGYLDSVMNAVWLRWISPVLRARCSVPNRRGDCVVDVQPLREALSNSFRTGTYGAQPRFGAVYSQAVGPS